MAHRDDSVAAVWLLSTILRGSIGLNKRKKVAIRKHRVKRKKQEEKRRMSTLARRR